MVNEWRQQERDIECEMSLVGSRALFCFGKEDNICFNVERQVINLTAD